MRYNVHGMDNRPEPDFPFPFTVVDPESGRGLVDFGGDMPIMRVRIHDEQTY